MSVIQKALLRLVQNSGRHMTAENILSELRETHPSASLATVYRNLDIFTRTGQIRRVAIQDNPKFYEGNMSPHHHAACVHCGRVVDLAAEGLSELVAESIEGEIVSLDLTANIVCKDCLDKVMNKTQQS